MIVTRRQKITIAVLVVYWIALAIFAHMPIPELVYQAKVSDKWLHFLAYLNLIFLTWFSIRPDGKVRWRNKAAWLVFFGIIVYGGIDEFIQPYLGRTKDLMDFLANAGGAAAGLIIFSFLTFWPSFLTVLAISIFGAATLIHADFSKVAPILDAVYHVLAYAVFTLVWAQLIPPRTRISRLLLIISLPLGLMLFVKASSMLMGRYFTTMEMLFSGGAIIAAAIIATCLSVRKRYQGPFLAKGL